MARFTIEDEIPASSSGFTIDDAPEVRTALTPGQIARASGAELPSPAQGFVTAMQGPLFGFLDEMTGAVQGHKIRSDRRRIRASLSRGPGFDSRHGGTVSQGLSILATVAPLMASAPVFVGGPQVVLKPGAPGAKQPHAQHGWRCGNGCRIRVSLRLASLRAAGAIF